MPDRAILARQVELLYRNTVLGQALTLFNATFLAGLWRESVGLHVALIWWLLVAAVAAARIVVAKRYRGVAVGAPPNPQPWLKAALIGAAGAGLVWAGGALLFMVGHEDHQVFFTAFVMAGMAAGAVPVLGAHRGAFRLYAWPIVTATLVAGFGTDFLHIAFCVMALAFLYGVTRSADYFHAALSDTLRLESEKDRLLADLTAAKARSEAAADAKGRFLSSVSHELRTPMNGILGMADLLANESPTPAQRDLLVPLRESATDLLEKIENMIELADLQVGLIPLHPAPFSLAEFLPAILGDQRRSALSKGLDFVMEQAPDLPEVVVGDLDKLRKILLHLVDNAVKFTARGSVIVRAIRAREAAPALRLRFEIEDSGPGIPLARQEHLFEIFAGGASLTCAQQGAGIGLPIAHRLAEAMGGTLAVESRPDAGTTVRLELPLALPQDNLPY